MATIRIRLNKNRIHNDGTYPVVYQVIHKRRKRLLYTKINLREQDFDNRLEKVVKTQYGPSIYKVRKLNKELTVGLNTLYEYEKILIKSKIDYTVDDIIINVNQASNKLLLKYINQLILQKIERGKNANAYKSTLSSFRKFVGDSDVLLSNISPLLIFQYANFLEANGVTENTIAYYLRNLRTIYNRALKENLITVDRNPFVGMQLSPRKTIKRALSRNAMKSLADIDLSDAPNLDIARDIFMFSFYLRGASFVDVVFLKKSSVSHGVVEYKRHKTGQYIKITVLPQLAKLIEKYSSHSEYLLPIVTNSETAYADYRKGLNRINRNLKTLSAQLKLDVELTSYCARHSWATIAKEKGAPISVISEALGHTSEKTTRIYLKAFDTSVIDQVNKDVATILD